MIIKQYIVINVFVLIFFFGLIGFVFAGGGGEEGNGGTSESTSSNPGFTSFSEVQGVIGVNTGGIFGGFAAVGISNDGSFGPSVGPGTFGGNAEFINEFVPPACSSSANLSVVALSFVRGNNPTIVVAVSTLDPYTKYIPRVSIINTGCFRTDRGDVDLDYRNEPPKASNGTFPVHLQLDFDKNGTIDYGEIVDSVGPLNSREVITIEFPAFSTAGAGAHEAIATVDPVDDENGCSGGWGCIKEVNETNEFTQQFSVTAPVLDLGSVLYIISQGGGVCEDPACDSITPTYTFTSALPSANRGIQRDIVDGDNVLLIWDGTKIDFASCTGNTIRDDGSSLTDFNGQFGGAVLSNGIPGDNRTNSSFALRRYDSVISEPSAGNYNVYTMICETTSGRTISDTHILNNGGDTSALTTLIPLPSNITLELGDTLTRYSYRIENNGFTDVSEFKHNLKIDTDAYIRYTESDQLESGLFRRYNQEVSWTPSMLGNYTVEICVDDINGGGSGRECRNGTITVVEPSLPSEIIAPTIEANPTLVRVGGTVEVTWNPGTYNNCTLSPQKLSDAAIRVSSSENGEYTISNYEITGATTLIIDCGDSVRDTVEIKVLPALYEI